MTEKSPLQSLQEWQELSEHFHSLSCKGLVAPENSLTVSLDWYLEPLYRDYTIRARWTLNGTENSHEVKFNTLDDRIQEGDLAVKTVKELAAAIAKTVTLGLEDEMFQILLSDTSYSQIRSNLLSGLSKQ